MGIPKRFRSSFERLARKAAPAGQFGRQALPRRERKLMTITVALFEGEAMLKYDPEQKPHASEWLALGEQERIDLASQFHKAARIKIPNAIAHASIHVIVENQIAENIEPIVRAMSRLQREGLSRHDALHAWRQSWQNIFAKSWRQKMVRPFPPKVISLRSNALPRRAGSMATDPWNNEDTVFAGRPCQIPPFGRNDRCGGVGLLATARDERWRHFSRRACAPEEMPLERRADRSEKSLRCRIPLFVRNDRLCRCLARGFDRLSPNRAT